MEECRSPEIEIVYSSSDDIIRTSVVEPDDNELPHEPWQ